MTNSNRRPLEEMARGKSNCRALFRATFARATAGGGGASLFKRVFHESGRLVADHLWVRRTWPHLRPGDLVQFFASVVTYRRADRSVGYTLDDLNGLIVLTSQS
jgi:hypothetical protein